MKKLVITLIVIFVLILTSCGNGESGSGNNIPNANYDALTDELQEMSDKILSDDHDIKFRIKVGTEPKDADSASFNELLINAKFFEVYIEKYGITSLLERYNQHVLCMPLSEGNDNLIEYKKRNGAINNALTSMPQYQELETIVFDGTNLESLHGADGYYGGLEDKTTEKKVSGDFNDSSNDNEIYEEEESQQVEIKYYGDWMIQHTTGLEYDEGEYGWKAGQFVDEEASWDEIDETTLYYCDVEILKAKNYNPGATKLEIKKADSKWFCLAHDDTIGSNTVHWIDADLSGLDQQVRESSYDFSDLYRDDIIEFGSYWQEEDLPEPISWLVLKVKKDKFLVVSDKAIECLPYHKKEKAITWDKCSLREWLNSDFYENAFSSEEQKLIKKTKISPDSKNDYESANGKITKDKVFLLSYEEAKKYFDEQYDRTCSHTSFAEEHYEKIDGQTRFDTEWWLRSRGRWKNEAKDMGNEKYAATVHDDGYLGGGSSVDNKRVYVRPAMWIKRD